MSITVTVSSIRDTVSSVDNERATNSRRVTRQRVNDPSSAIHISFWVARLGQSTRALCPTSLRQEQASYRINASRSTGDNGCGGNTPAAGERTGTGRCGRPVETHARVLSVGGAAPQRERQHDDRGETELRLAVLGGRFWAARGNSRTRALSGRCRAAARAPARRPRPPAG
jgi:hypothetical protein